MCVCACVREGETHTCDCVRQSVCARVCKTYACVCVSETHSHLSPCAGFRIQPPLDEVGEGVRAREREREKRRD
jgi:hypothetical protein